MTDQPLSHNVDPELREVLAAVGDELIPAGAGLPSARDVGVAEGLLDQLLAARPDLHEPLTQLLASLRGTPPHAVLEMLRARHVADPINTDYDVLTLVLAGGYLMSDRVGEILGYPGQQDKPVDTNDIVTVMNEGLLDPVIARGPIYRPTPP